MLKKIILLISVLALFVHTSPVYAEKSPQLKVLVGFKYYNTSTWGMTTKSVYKKVITNNVIPVLTTNNCAIVTDEKYFDKLKANGYSDFTSIERADLISIYEDDGFHYLILIEMDPIRGAVGPGFESSAHVKIVDMQNSKYIFNGKIPGMTKYGGTGTVANNIGKNIKKVLIEKLFI